MAIPDRFQKGQVGARRAELVVQQKQHFAQRKAAWRQYAVTYILQQRAVATKL